jgi:phosphonate metabolism-associated iron-containing alcohol dehydrogenase
MALFYNPVKAYFGIAELDRLSEILQDNTKHESCRRILLLTGKRSLQESGQLTKINKQLTGYDVSLFNDIPSNPDVANISTALEKTVEFNFDAILAVGGGSVIDTGKVLAAFKNQQAQTVAELRQAIKQKAYLKDAVACPVWAVPTTAGTGSEVTSWATVWDKEENAKYSVDNLLLYPEIAIVDPVLTLGLSTTMTASSALDALSHATEAYWSKHTNEIVRIYALRAIELIAKNLADLLDKPHDLDLRAKIAYGSLFAGLAFSNTRTTACHSISYPLTLTCGLNHGVAVCLTLGKMLVKNEECLISKHDLLRAYGVTHAAGVDGFILEILAKAGISARLRDYGVSPDALEDIADRSFTPGRMDNNPADIDKEFILKLLENIY